MRVADLYGEAHDLPCRQGEPALTYMVASVPRSGSTHFILRLWSCGIFGRPLEYFNDNTNVEILSRLGRGDLLNYWSALKGRRTAENGVFGFKMFTDHYRQLIARERNFVTNLTPNEVIFYTREDKIAQAVSYARAIQTHSWFADAREVRRPSYSFEQIHQQVDSVLTQEAAWERIFAAMGVVPLRIGYAELLENESEVMRRVAAHLGLELGLSTALEGLTINRQADGLSAEWAKRYVEERDARGLISEAGRDVLRPNSFA